jgi:2-hydroxychromene-2-carboxylate isomerase
MARRLDFWFDYTCPYAYLASTRVRALAERMGAELVWQPMLLGGVFRASGTPQNLSETLIPAKARHNELDYQRWAALFGVPLRKPTMHPVSSVEALRATIVTGCDPDVIAGFYRAYWVEGRSPSEPSTIRDVVSAAGHDASAVLARIEQDAVKADLRARTDRAIALGLFGAPTFIVDDGPLVWGQDRMHFVAGTRVEDLLPRLARAPRPARPTLEIYFDFSSPYAYLGSTQAEALADRTGAELAWHPVLLGGLFKAIGQAPVPIATWSAAKQAFYARDMDAWAAYYAVPFRFPSHFPQNSLKALRAYLALDEASKKDFRERVFRAIWAEDRDIAEDATLRDALGQKADEVLSRAQSAEVKGALIAATDRARDAGVFGAPTWIVDGRELFWGQDRIPLVERALTGTSSSP